MRNAGDWEPTIALEPAGTDVNGFNSGAVVLWKIDADGNATVFELAQEGQAVDLANSAIGELARVVGWGKGKKFRGKTPNVAHMWELIVPDGT